jgi:hypothetical protein
MPARVARLLMLLAVAPTPLACRATRATPPSSTSELETLVAWMSGSFSSAAQAAAEPDNFRDIRLHMTPIWTDRRDGPWLYVEQAAATSLDRPYRQRVYQLRAHSAGVFESVVYELPGDPLLFAGAWQTPARFTTLDPATLILRDGCSLALRRRSDGAFVGSTSGTSCHSTLRGASYAVSEATITADGLVTWDRGYAADGRQVWGAETGGYEFRRVTN